jgi:hypothetical protein
MFKRKYFLKDIEVEGQKADRFFTEESYVVIDFPSLREKMEIKEKVKSFGEDNWRSNMDIIARMICEVNCFTVDYNDEVKSFDELTCFPDGELVVKWLGEMAQGGLVPKKI